MTISFKDLFEKTGKLGPDEIIIDVRNPDEYAQGHIKGSRNCPLPEITKFVEDLKKYKTIYVHCQRGGRAQKATEALQEAGLNNFVCISEGGMANWIEEGYPVHKPDNK